MIFKKILMYVCSRINKCMYRKKMARKVCSWKSSSFIFNKIKKIHEKWTFTLYFCVKNMYKCKYSSLEMELFLGENMYKYKYSGRWLSVSHFGWVGVWYTAQCTMHVASEWASRSQASEMERPIISEVEECALWSLAICALITKASQRHTGWWVVRVASTHTHIQLSSSCSTLTERDAAGSPWVAR